MDTGNIVLSAMQPETIAGRAEKNNDKKEEVN